MAFGQPLKPTAPRPPMRRQAGLAPQQPPAPAPSNPVQGPPGLGGGPGTTPTPPPAQNYQALFPQPTPAQLTTPAQQDDAYRSGQMPGVAPNPTSTLTNLLAMLGQGQ